MATNVWISDTPGCLVLGPTVIAGEALSSGDLVYIKDSDGKAYQADADGSGTYPCVGAAYEDADADDAVSLVLYGFRNDGSTYAEGAVVFLSGTAGGHTQSHAATGNTTPQVVGYAYTTVKWVFSVLGIPYNVPA